MGRRSDRCDARLAAILADASPDALIAVTPDGTVRFWNHGAETLFGYPRGEAVGRSAFDLIVPDHQVDAARQLLAETLETGSAARESVRRRKDGLPLQVEVATTLVRDVSGEGELIVAIHKDASAVRSVHATARALEDKTRALQAAQEELARTERLAVLGQLAGGVSHELRHPLGVIKNAVYYLDMVLPAEDPKSRKHLRIIEREIATAERIVTGLLDFARVSPAQRMAMDVNEMVRAYLAVKTLPANVVLERRLAEWLPPVLADAGQLELVLGNLVTNAVQAMPEGGTLTVETAAVGDRVTICVADTGHGIRREDLAKVFEPLFTTKGKGIGLGLSVARRLAEANGATVAVASERDRGSRFVISCSTTPPPGAP